MTGLKLCGTGSYLPDNVIDNEAFTAIVETSDEWIRTRSGIATRRIANGDTTWSMGTKAARKALEDAGIPETQVDLILVTTVTSDYLTPSMSCVIQHALGAVNAVCIDINCACAGFVYAMDMAWRYLSCGDYQHRNAVPDHKLRGPLDLRAVRGRGGCMRGAGRGRKVRVASWRRRQRDAPAVL